MAAEVDNISDPFIALMRECRMPDLLTSARETCIAESPLNGHMCTVEGYVYDSEVVPYGIVDSIRGKYSNSFQRYQYPSALPTEVQYRMMELTRRVIGQIDLNDTCFNVEYFYNQTEDRIYLLEINPRTSQSHGHLFERVHGHSQFQLLVELALGRRPKPMERNGEFKMAAKFMHRTYEPGIVRRMPSSDKLREIEKRHPGTAIAPIASEGLNLEDLLFQDAYSFELADIHIGGDDELDLWDRYQEIVKEMDIVIEPKAEKR